MSRDRGKNKAKLNFEVQSLHQIAPSSSSRISGQKKLLRAAGTPNLLLPDPARQLSSQYTAHWKQDLRRSWPIEGLRLSLRAEVHLPEATYDEKFVVGVSTLF